MLNPVGRARDVAARFTEAARRPARNSHLNIHDSIHLFILGPDYHLGDLLWLTTVIRALRDRAQPSQVIVSLPDRAISRVLEENPLIDELRYGEPDTARKDARTRFGNDLVVHDLRLFPLGFEMVRQWRRRVPWLYYRDLWLEPRGQWLATYLGLGELRDGRPRLHLTENDRAVARELPRPYILFAPHVGEYSLPLVGTFWRRLKGWPMERWIALAEQLRADGYETITLAARGQSPVPGTEGLIGLPIRQVAGAIESAAALVTVESGLWFIAAALHVPFLIVRWWLPRAVDWPRAMGAPNVRIFRDCDSVSHVLGRLNGLMDHGGS